MRNAIFGAALLACWAGQVNAATLKPGHTYLMSLTGLKIWKDEGVDKFQIDTWGVDVISVCRIPPGWQLTAGKSIDPTGVISGQASLGVTFITRKYLKTLRDLVLLKLEGKLDRTAVKFTNGERPATFAGKASIWTYSGDDETDKERPFTYRALRFKAARRCPPPGQ